jgi:DNA-binding transcriptional ArsR family regulator
MPATTDQVLHALADQTRREILRLVWSDEQSSGEIAARFPFTRQAVSQHLGVLLDSGLVLVRQEGTRRVYRADHRPMERLRVEFESFWDDSLVRLKTAATRLEHESSKHGRRR